MNALNSNQILKIKILTPVHVGAGDHKNWQRSLDYIQDAGRIFILNQHKVLLAMSEQLLRVYTGKLSQSAFKDAEKLIIEHLDIEEVSDFNMPYDGGELSTEIKTLIRDGLNKPYIPGSSIKGAMRSGIFHYLAQVKNTSPTNRNANNDLLGSFGQSIMRYIRPDDTVNLNQTLITNVALFNLYQRGNDWKSDYKSGFSISFEHFKVGAEGTFRLSIAEGMSQLVGNYQKEFLPKNLQHLFSGNPLSNMLKIINDSTADHIQREIDFFKAYDEASDTDLIIEELEKLLYQSEQITNGCLMRMSSGSGYHSITGDWRFKKHSGTLSGPNQQNKVYSQTTRQIEPRYKSRKVMANGDELLMGFVRLSI